MSIALTRSFRTLVSSAQYLQRARGCAGIGTSGQRFVLGIESSCDDTAAAIVSHEGEVLGEALATQEDVHREYGGVVPMLAQQAHADAIAGVVDEAMQRARLPYDDLDAVAVTVGPGLSLCLRVGILHARSVAVKHGLPMLNCHHMEAHALVARMGRTTSLQFPFLCLLVSGGHNLLVLVRGVGDYMQLGTTADDAVGEAYDKVARMLGLELLPSGGPALEAFAKGGDPAAFPFTVAMAQKKDTCNFSYSGLKNSVRLAVEAHVGDDLGPATSQVRADIAASFQAVAVRQLAQRTQRAIAWAREVEPSVSCLVVAGGVAANQTVRRELDRVAAAEGVAAVYPPPRLCTDNGVMVAWAGHERLALGLAELPPATAEPAEGEWLDIRARWPLTSERHPRYKAQRPRNPRKPASSGNRARGRREHESLTDLTRARLQPLHGKSQPYAPASA